ncbi:MAG: hypothetical protein AB7K71_25305 [Polyangiaceae bacterium]
MTNRGSFAYTDPRRLSRRSHTWIWGLGALFAAACGADDTSSSGCHDYSCQEPKPGIAVQHDFEAQLGLNAEVAEIYRAPFPNENQRQADGHINLDGFPNPTETSIVDSLLGILRQDARGFGVSSAMFLSLDQTPPEAAALDAGESLTLADYAKSLDSSAPAFVLNVGKGSPGYLERQPVEVEFRKDGGPFGAPNLVSLLPLQGRPLRASTLHAAVLLRNAFAVPLGQSKQLVSLLHGIKPPGLSDAAFAQYQAAVAALGEAGVAKDDIAGLGVFSTDDPVAPLERAVRYTQDQGVPPLSEPFEAKEVFDDFCVYQARLNLPVYQTGEPPYNEVGGGWTFDAAGDPVLDHQEEARIVVTIPRRAMPTAGFPVVLMSRTGGGGDRPLVDRGVRGADGVPLEPGTGPALEFARVGYAGVSLDGPHGGIRNVTGGDEQFLMFNVGNMLALRDNVRQSALELALAAKLIDALQVDVSNCGGADTQGAPAHFDPHLKVLMGHSMGATITPLTLATEQSFKGIILSGAGGSWIENVLYKQRPVSVKVFAEILLKVTNQWSLHAADPALSLFQWAGEPADPPIYGRRIVQEPPAGYSPRHVLMQQGIVDNYILPPIANSTSLSFGLDLAGPELDSMSPELAQFAPLGDRLQFSGRQSISLPASGNIDGSTTAVVLQHPEDGVEDGHEVIFQTELPKAQYRCFLSTLAAGKVPTVPDEGGSCP